MMARTEKVVSELSDEEVLKHFDGKPAFKDSRAFWSPQHKEAFCQLARVVHAAGLDWWHMGNKGYVRFGRKNPGSGRASGVLGGVVPRHHGPKIYWERDVGEMPRLNPEPLTDEWVAKITNVLAAKHETLNNWLGLETERRGMWPDQLQDDPTEAGEEVDEEMPTMNATIAPALNRIYYGPPGTGKTYTLSELLKQDYEQVMTAVSDQEWRAQLISERIAHLTWWEAAAAALYDLDGSAKVAQLQAHPFIQAVALAKGRNKNIPQTLWGTLQHHTVENSTTVNSKLRQAPAVFDKMQDSTWRFAGDWQEVCTNLIETVKAYKTTPPSAGTVQRYSFVTFHQSYGYEEFVEGLRPVLSAEAEEGEIQYEIRTGVFKELCRRARLTPNQRFAMVIDEINRGNISKIFGELITLIEPDKREGAENMVSVILPYSGESFSVPANVDIIGTMNTADRSLALLDTALRRRFEFVPVWPDVRDEAGAPLFGLRVRVSEEQVIDIPRMLSVMNQRIEALYDRDHCIGHAYFTALAQALDGEERFAMLSQIFNHRIIPLLEEYFFEDWQKIRLVLADNQKPEHAQFVTESPNHEADLERLFGNNHGLDVYATTPRHMVQDASFEEPDAYIGIYQKLIA